VRFFGRDGEETALHVMFMCVENAGRSQMAAALAEREVARRGLDEEVVVHSAGTRPADAIHQSVVDALAAVDIDISDRSPRLVDLEELKGMDYVVLMGCYIAEFRPSSFGGDTREWELDDPAGESPESVRALRSELEGRVDDLFDEIEQEAMPDV
jgi:arsenate reductase